MQSYIPVYRIFTTDLYIHLAIPIYRSYIMTITFVYMLFELKSYMDLELTFENEYMKMNKSLLNDSNHSSQYQMNTF